MAKFDKVDRAVDDLVAASTKLEGRVESLKKEVEERHCVLENMIGKLDQKKAVEEGQFVVSLLNHPTNLAS